MYADIIPVLIKSIQELSQQVEELKKTVNTNSTQNPATSSIETNAASKLINVDAALEQNAPNPFNSITVIRYRIPSTVNNAQVIVSSASGNTMKTFTLTNKGAGSVTINAGELAAGSYYYTLIVDGKKADSKQMILVK